jgi:thioredoxin-related protein
MRRPRNARLTFLSIPGRFASRPAARAGHSVANGGSDIIKSDIRSEKSRRFRAARNIPFARPGDESTRGQRVVGYRENPMFQRLVPAVVVVCLFNVAAHEEEPFHDLSFDAACKLAGEQNKVVMIDFYTTWCGPCKMLDKNTWSDRTVQKWLGEKTVSLKLDAEKEVSLAKKYRVSAYPTILFIKPDGEVIDRLVGYADPKKFLESSNASLSGDTSIIRAQRAAEDGENDPMARMNYGRELVRTGEHEKALAEFLWCFDEGAKQSTGFVGVRLSFLLGDIARLGQVYPPAMKALTDRRDAAAKALRSGKPKFENAAEFSAINRTLEQSDRTLEMFDELRKGGSDTDMVRQILFRDVFELLIEARRYDDVIAAAGDVPGRIEQEFSRLEEMKKYDKSDERMLSYMKQMALDNAGKYVEALAGAGRDADAISASERVIKFDDSKDTYVTLLKHLKRAENQKVRDHVLNLGLKSVPEPEHGGLRMAAGVGA